MRLFVSSTSMFSISDPVKAFLLYIKRREGTLFFPERRTAKIETLPSHRRCVHPNAKFVARTHAQGTERKKGEGETGGERGDGLQ